MPPNIFLICPVSTATDEDKIFLDWYVSNRRRKGENIYYPANDTDQSDTHGKDIMRTNRAAIRAADIVRVFYRTYSTGSLFDIGMTIMGNNGDGKAIELVNDWDLDSQNDDLAAAVLRIYALRRTTGLENLDRMERELDIMARIEARKRELSQTDLLQYTWKRTPEMIFDFGMVYMSDVSIMLLNRGRIAPKPTKSFENVLISLHTQTIKAELSRIGIPTGGRETY